MSESKENRNFEVQQRREKALEMRVAGKSLKTISEKLGIAKGQVSQDLKKILNQKFESEALKARQHQMMQLQKLNALYAGALERVYKGDMAAIAEARQIIREQNNLMNLYGMPPIQDDNGMSPFEKLIRSAQREENGESAGDDEEELDY